MEDVTILLFRGETMVQIDAIGLAQARDRIAGAWPSLFPDGPERDVAALETVAVLVAEGLGK